MASFFIESPWDGKYDNSGLRRRYRHQVNRRDGSVAQGFAG